MNDMGGKAKKIMRTYKKELNQVWGENRFCVEGPECERKA